MSWVEEVVALEPAIRRYPSAHNTQPATLHIEPEALVVGWDPERELAVGDPSRRDLWLSLGAFLESVVIAAGDAGHPVKVVHDVEPADHRVARLVPAAESSSPFTVADLWARRSARGPYRQPFLDQPDVDEVAALTGEPRTALTVLDPELVDTLLPVAERWSWTPPALAAETRSWLRLDHGDPRYRRDGLSDRALALSSAQASALRVATSGPAWSVLRRLGGPSLLAAASTISGRGTVVALSAPRASSATPEHLLDRGRTLMRLWLAAARCGYAVHPLSVLIDAPSTSRRVHEAVAADAWSASSSVPEVLSVFRIGQPLHSPPQSARRPVPLL